LLKCIKMNFCCVIYMVCRLFLVSNAFYPVPTVWLCISGLRSLLPATMRGCFRPDPDRVPFSCYFVCLGLLFGWCFNFTWTMSSSGEWYLCVFVYLYVYTHTHTHKYVYIYSHSQLLTTLEKVGVVSIYNRKQFF